MVNCKLVEPFAAKLAEKLRTFESRYLFCELYAPKIKTRVRLELDTDSAIHSMIDETIKYYGSLEVFEEGLKRLYPEQDFNGLKDCK